jgi:DNA-binding MarR family transcriptional regulator
VVKNLIRKGLVLRQLCPEDLYVLTDEGKELFQQRKVSSMGRLKRINILFFVLLAFVVAADTWLIATAISEDETNKKLHHEQQ